LIEIRRRFQIVGERWIAGAELANQSAVRSTLEEHYKQAADLLQIENKKVVDEIAKRQIDAIYSSTSWRLARLIMRPGIALRKGTG
jgi:hypothetical protein